ncbi:LbetaH domain-containing protein [Desulfocicer vacuolatum]|nr:hypothetical protein [Desulfocicer vacuolatum]
MVQTLYGIDIHRHATIGKGLYIGHFGGIKIGRCTMGPGCSVHQQVKLDDDTTVGARVWMGSHAVINHGAVVEDDTTLAPGAVIPACGIVKKHTLVMGAPARVIKRNYDNRALIGRPLAHAGGTK